MGTPAQASSQYVLPRRTSWLLRNPKQAAEGSSARNRTRSSIEENGQNGRRWTRTQDSKQAAAAAAKLQPVIEALMGGPPPTPRGKGVLMIWVAGSGECAGTAAVPECTKPAAGEEPEAVAAARAIRSGIQASHTNSRNAPRYPLTLAADNATLTALARRPSWHAQWDNTIMLYPEAAFAAAVAAGLADRAAYGGLRSGQASAAPESQNDRPYRWKLKLPYL